MLNSDSKKSDITITEFSETAGFMRLIPINRNSMDASTIAVLFRRGKVMAQQVNLTNKNTSQIRQGYMGFSWTTLFFSAFVPLFRSTGNGFLLCF